MWQGKPELLPFVFGGNNILIIGIGVVFVIIPLNFLVPLTTQKEFATGSFLIGLAVLSVGLLAIFGTIFFSIHLCRNTEYLVTDQRIIIKGAYASRPDRIINFYEAGGVRVDSIYGGTGNIFVENPRPVSTVGTVGLGGSYSHVFPDIKAIREPYKVQKIIQDAIKGYKWKSQKTG